MPFQQFLTQINIFLKTKINLIVLTLCGISWGFWNVHILKKYYYFGFTADSNNTFRGWEAALFNQILENLKHGNLANNFYGVNFVADHCHFLSFLLAPLYWLFPDPLLLPYIKVGVFFVGAYVFFLILKKRIHPWIALGAMLTFTLAPANIAMLKSVFNYEPFSIPLVFLIFKAFDEKKYALYMVCCFLLAISKEQMPLVVMMFGILALILAKKDKLKWGMIPLLMGFIIFVVEVFILIPYVRNNLPMEQGYHWSKYAQFGKTPLDILWYLFTHPLKILAQFITPENVRWYNDLFGVWGGLSFLSPQILLPALPLFFKTILSGNKYEHMVLGVYYASTFTPYIFLGTWCTLNYIQGQWRNWIHGAVVCIMLIHALVFFPQWISVIDTPIKDHAVIMQRLINKIPSDSTVLSFCYSSGWKDLYWWDVYVKGTYYSFLKFELPDQVEYLLANLSDKPNEKHISKLMLKENFYERWKLVESIEDKALFIRNQFKEEGMRLIERNNKPFVNNNDSLIVLEKTISLEEVEFPNEYLSKNRIFSVTLYYKSLKETKGSFEISFKILSKAKVLYEKQRPIGFFINQTKQWHKGEYIRENYFYLLPRLESGRYTVEINLYNPVTKKWGEKFEEQFIID